MNTRKSGIPARLRQAGSACGRGRVSLGGFGSAILLSSVVALLSGCAAGGELERVEAPASEAVIEAAPAPLEPYQEEIPGTLVKIDMIPVPGGSVTIQTPEGEKTVEVGPFWMSKTELPWEAYDAYLLGLDMKGPGAPVVDATARPSKPYVLPGDNFGHDGRPALGMSTRGAAGFAQWLSRKTRRTYRVPTQAEWEHACRVGETEQAAADLKEYAWYWDNADAQTRKVGTLQPNALGIYDMLGNAAEWVVEEDPELRAVIGGSWQSFPEEVTCGTLKPYDKSWQATDPQIPKSTWWLSDGPFVGLRLISIPKE